MVGPKNDRWSKNDQYIVSLLFGFGVVIFFDPDWALLLDVFNGLRHFSPVGTSLNYVPVPEIVFDFHDFTRNS